MSGPEILRLSTLPHTWLIDMDGVVSRHNSHLESKDSLLPGVRAFWSAIPAADCIILLSARGEEHRETTLAFLAAEGLRVDRAIFGLPTGERILINDAKPSGLTTAHAVNTVRDEGLADFIIELSPEL